MATIQKFKREIEVTAMLLTKNREVIAIAIEWTSGIDMSTSIIGRNATIDMSLAENGVILDINDDDCVVPFGHWIIQDEHKNFSFMADDEFKAKYRVEE